MIDITFGIIDINNVVRRCAMLARHRIDGVQEALANFERSHPAAKDLRNALEHFA